MAINYFDNASTTKLDSRVLEVMPISMRFMVMLQTIIYLNS
jgi:hypothetical protein